MLPKRPTRKPPASKPKPSPTNRSNSRSPVSEIAKAESSQTRSKSRVPVFPTSEKFVVVDIEGTGVELFHGCRPFLIGAMNQDQRRLRWKIPVGKDRRVWVNNPEIIHQEIREFADGADFVIHSSDGFDIRALSIVGINILSPENSANEQDWEWDRVQNTHTASHVLDSEEAHGLKIQAEKYCGIPIGDEKVLREAVAEARRVAGRLEGWVLGEDVNHDYHLPHTLWDLNPVLDTGNTSKLGYHRHKRVRDLYPEWRDLILMYNDMDLIRCAELYKLQHYLFRNDEKSIPLLQNYERERLLLPQVYAMGSAGMTLPRTRLAETQTHFTSLTYKAEKEAQKYSRNCATPKSRRCNDDEPLNVRSPKQLIDEIYHTGPGGVIPFKLSKGGKTGKQSPSTDAETLERILDEDIPWRDQRQTTELSIVQFKAACKKEKERIRNLCSHILDYRKANTTGTTVKGYSTDAIPHPEHAFLVLRSSYNPVGAKTTRFTASRIQNVSKGGKTRDKKFSLRGTFGPLPGFAWYPIDYSNLELRIFAYIAGDRKLIHAFENGISVHYVIFCTLWPHLAHLSPDEAKQTAEYQWTKNGNFSLIYGASEGKADATYHQYGAYQLIRKEFPAIDQFMRETINFARKYGYVETAPAYDDVAGYRLYVPSGEPYKGTNYRIQGTAGIIMKDAMVECYYYLKSMNALESFSIIANIHDELIFNGDLSDPMVESTYLPTCFQLISESGDKYGIPTPAECSKTTTTWAEAEPFRIAS